MSVLHVSTLIHSCLNLLDTPEDELETQLVVKPWPSDDFTIYRQDSFWGRFWSKMTPAMSSVSSVAVPLLSHPEPITVNMACHVLNREISYLLGHAGEMLAIRREYLASGGEESLDQRDAREHLLQLVEFLRYIRPTQIPRISELFHRQHGQGLSDAALDFSITPLQLHLRLEALARRTATIPFPIIQQLAEGQILTAAETERRARFVSAIEREGVDAIEALWDFAVSMQHRPHELLERLEFSAAYRDRDEQPAQVPVGQLLHDDDGNTLEVGEYGGVDLGGSYRYHYGANSYLIRGKNSVQLSILHVQQQRDTRYLSERITRLMDKGRWALVERQEPPKAAAASSDTIPSASPASQSQSSSSLWSYIFGN